jgi:hypothetical protein
MSVFPRVKWLAVGTIEYDIDKYGHPHPQVLHPDSLAGKASNDPAP